MADDHDALVRLQQQLDDYISAHREVHALEKDARALALAALQSQTRLILAALGLIVTVGAAVLALTFR